MGLAVARVWGAASLSSAELGHVNQTSALLRIFGKGFIRLGQKEVLSDCIRLLIKYFLNIFPHLEDSSSASAAPTSALGKRSAMAQTAPGPS